MKVQSSALLLSRLAFASSSISRFICCMVYADSYIKKEDKVEKHPTIDYQVGSIRDDFDFGQLLLIRSSLLHEYAAQRSNTSYEWAGLYVIKLTFATLAQVGFYLSI